MTALDKAKEHIKLLREDVERRVCLVLDSQQNWTSIERLFTNLNRRARQSLPAKGQHTPLHLLDQAFQNHYKVVFFYSKVVEPCKTRPQTASLKSYGAEASDALDKATALKDQIRNEYVRVLQQAAAKSSPPSAPERSSACASPGGPAAADTAADRSSSTSADGNTVEQCPGANPSISSVDGSEMRTNRPVKPQPNNGVAQDGIHTFDNENCAVPNGEHAGTNSLPSQSATTNVSEPSPWTTLAHSTDSSLSGRTASVSSLPAGPHSAAAEASQPASTAATVADIYSRMLAQEGGGSAADQYHARMASPSERQQLAARMQSPRTQSAPAPSSPALHSQQYAPRQASMLASGPSHAAQSDMHQHPQATTLYHHNTQYPQGPTYTGSAQPLHAAPSYATGQPGFTGPIAHPIPPYVPAAQSSVLASAPSFAPTNTSTTGYPNAAPPPATQAALPFTPTIPARTPVRYEPETTLKPLLMNPAVVAAFLRAASSNSAIGKETCGLLVGRLDTEALTMTAVIIPKQGGDKDSCQPTDEGENEVFEYQAEHDLLSLGWIHTHPTQTAFLSSVDLHTSFPYQLMLPEALAIVCSIKYEDTRYFRLSERGLQDIAACREQGFHPHPNSEALFCDASHVQLKSSAETELVDMRV
eukprot:m.115861 g.115861  ORF g.115861 m.115861 type:complete len:645 (+) comp15504_c0_seq2:94-2028(+)